MKLEVSGFLTSDYTAAAAAKLLHSCPTLCDPIDGSPPGFSAHGVSQERTLERVVISSSFPTQGLNSHLLHRQAGSSPPIHLRAPVLSRVWLCNPTDCSLPGSSVHEILQARTLDWVAMPSYRESSPPRDQIHASYVSLALAGRFFITSATWEAHIDFLSTQFSR